MPSIEPVDGRSVTTVANLQVLNDPSIQEFDSVQVSMELYLKLFKVDDTLKDRYILVKFLGSPDSFKEFRLYKITRINDNLPHSTILFVNSSFLLKYNDKFTLTSALIRSVESDIPVLQNVFVSVPLEIYKVIQTMSSDSVKEQMISKFLKGAIAIQNDVIRDINGEIILCEPVNQGLVTHDTNIYIVKREQDDEARAEAAVEDSELSADLDISNYLSSSLNIDFDPAAYPKYKVVALDNRLLHNGLPGIWAKEDNELFVFVNTRDLMKFGFPVFNGDTVYLNFENIKLLVKVFTIAEPNSSYPTGSIYLSPILSINLGISADDLVHLEPIKPIKNRELHVSNLVPLAKSVTISRIASPITLDKTYQQHFFSALKTSFNSNFRVIKKGDFIPVTIDSILAKTMFDLANEDDLGVLPTGDPDSVAWFKISEVTGDFADKEDEENKKINTDQFIIDPLKTRMILSGVEFTRLPANEKYDWYNYLSLPPIFNFNKHIKTPSPKFQYARILKKIILTNINSKLNLKTYVLLNSMSRGLGKTTLVRNMSYELGLNLIELDCVDFINPGSELKTIGLISGTIDKYLNQEQTEDNSFNLVYLKHIESLCPEINENEQGSNISVSLTLKLIQLLDSYFTNHKNIIFIFSCNDVDKLNNSLKSIMKFQIEFNVPNEQERLEVFKYLIDNELARNLADPMPEFYDTVETVSDTIYKYNIRNDVKLSSLALQSAGLTPRDLISIFKKSKNLAVKRLLKVDKKNLQNLVTIGNGGMITLIPEDFNSAINEARNQFSDSIGAPRIPNVKWEDIGGLDVVKDEILDTIDMPLKHPELFNNGLKKRSGILFYGPPGTGKTLLAKAIATNFSLNFFSVKGPELLNMYIGESEANVRRVFQKARDAKPCVIFFDELDSVAPKRGNQGDSGGVMDRIVSQLLAELDGMSGGGGEGGAKASSGDGVFVVGATNRPDLLDEALLRPGRFDKMLYLGISDTDEKQVKILEALTRKFKLDEDVQLEVIAEKCTFNFTGADFYALCSDSMLNAMTRIANEVDAKIKKFNEERQNSNQEVVSTRWWFDNVATEEDTEVTVKMVDFVKAQNELVPSVSAEELDHYLRIRQNFEGAKKKVEQPEAPDTAGDVDIQINRDGLANGHINQANINGGADIQNDVNGYAISDAPIQEATNTQEEATS